jgi:D-cysteine desulfhydrase family pyridoxal phosphate-dependent enzyme
MPRLSAALGGGRLFVKRDDLTGLAFGGNKTRKLELLLGEARASGARTLITRGASQSNHCRQTAAAAAKMGMGCILVLRGSAPATMNGNLLLDEVLGAELIWTEGEDPDAVLDTACARADAEGRSPFRIPYGGSSPLGAAAYAAAFEELMLQDSELDAIVLASSSGGTQAGLVAGARMHGWSGTILGISVETRASELRARVAGLSSEVLKLLGESAVVAAAEVDVTDAYLGEGYGIPGPLEREGILQFARQEGLLLDPVYTGRAGGALLDLLRRGALNRSGKVVFWHTGGGPGLFAYADELRGLREKP